MNEVARLNDAFRTTFAGGRVLMTSGVDALPSMVKATALQQVAAFSSFTADNDPYGEHDFGSFELCSRKFFGRSTTTTNGASTGRKTPPMPARQPACSRSCSPKSTSPRKGAFYIDIVRARDVPVQNYL